MVSKVISEGVGGPRNPPLILPVSSLRAMPPLLRMYDGNLHLDARGLTLDTQTGSSESDEHAIR